MTGTIGVTSPIAWHYTHYRRWAIARKIPIHYRGTHNMKKQIFALALATVVAPLAQADQVLTYQGLPMQGTSTTFTDSTPAPTTATLDLQVWVSGSAAQNNLAVTNFGVSVVDPGLPTLYFPTVIGTITTTGNNSCFGGSNYVTGCIDLTTSHNQLTGAQVGVSMEAYNITESVSWNVDVGPTGDTVSWSNFACDYPSPTCTVNTSNTTAGTWTAAPEINPSIAIAALTLLLGGVAVFKSRRV